MMKLDRRRFEILSLIEKNGVVRIQELASLFNTTEMTIRRDLNRLSALGFIKRVHGGAEVKNIDNVLFNITLSGRHIEYKKEKQKIGALAAQFVRENELIFIHGGTTTYELAVNLPRDFSYQIVTNSVPILNVLKEYDNVNVLSTGGILQDISGTLAGSHAEILIEQINIDTLFMGASGVSIEKGATEFDFNIASLKKKIISRSKKRILLVDSHKFNIVRSIAFVKLSEFQIIITDEKIDPGVKNELEALGCQVIY